MKFVRVQQGADHEKEGQGQKVLTHGGGSVSADPPLPCRAILMVRLLSGLRRRRLV